MNTLLKIFIICCIAVFAAHQVSAASPTKKLNQIIHKISVIKTNLTKNKQQKINLEQQLKHAEINIGIAATNLKRANQNIYNQQIFLQALSKNQSHYENELQRQQHFILDQTRGVYMLQTNSPIKMLLNQEDPAKTERMLVYNNYLLSSRLKIMTKMQQTIQDLKKNKVKIQEHTEMLVKLKNKQQDERNKLEQLKAKHIKILGTVKNNIQSQSESLKTLLANKENLEKVIARITAAKKAVKHKEYAAPKAIANQKFLWPTKGKIITHYGSSIEHSQWKWNGTLIAAPEGQEIHAIAPGKIVYADWLSGYGLLLIIEHEHGFMSLYGRNHSIYKKLGAKVLAGEVISTVGRSGGYDESALFFGVRYFGKPINPEIWNKNI